MIQFVSRLLKPNVASLLFFITLVLFFSIIYQNIFAQSPSFSRQVIKDVEGDYLKEIEVNETKLLVKLDKDCIKSNPFALDIRSVSYISDGKTLSTTIWLNETLDKKNPFENLSAINYGVYIDVDSTYNAGLDYYTTLEWTSDSGAWINYTAEFGSQKDKKLLIKPLKSFNITNMDHIDLDFDLSFANFPKQYKVLFAALGQSFSCKVRDVTNIYQVPSPEFSISTGNSSLEIVKGETKEVSLHIDSDTNLNSKASLYIQGADPQIDASITSKDLSILPTGSAITKLKIKTFDYTDTGSYAIPVVIDFSFPADFNITAGTERVYNFKNITSANITKRFDIIATVLPPPTLDEKIQNFANWLSPINSIWTFITAIGVVMIPIIIKLYSKRKK